MNGRATTMPSVLDAARNNTPGAPGGIAAPAGGAFGCRGCANSTLAIATSIVLSVLTLWPQALPAQEDAEVMLPSGLAVTYLDRIDESPVWRYRYVAPALNEDTVDFEAVAEDMAVLCATHALPQLQHDGQSAERIIVSLMSEKLDFGVMSPEVRQFFESYSIEDNLCIWEVF